MRRLVFVSALTRVHLMRSGCFVSALCRGATTASRGVSPERLAANFCCFLFCAEAACSYFDAPLVRCVFFSVRDFRIDVRQQESVNTVETLKSRSSVGC